MSKLLTNTLERVSENNNEYRKYLRKLSNQIDERTTALVGDVVTLSNYTTDFSSTITASKEKIVSPINATIESYIIKDLRGVETVNEQFIDKINDKIENTAVESKEDKEKFISSLDTLLNNKYLEIVSIKRTPFLVDNKNDEIEEHIFNFVSYLRSVGTYDENGLISLINSFKNDIYKYVSNTISDISLLYQNNFINTVSSELNDAVEYQSTQSRSEFKPFIPEIEPVTAEIKLPEEPVVEPTPVVSETTSIEDAIPHINSVTEPILTSEEALEENKPLHNYVSEYNFEPSVPKIEKQDIADSVVEHEDLEPVIPEPNIEPVVSEPAKIVEPETKKTYDVEEILKIAKSPVVSMDPVTSKDNGGIDKIIDLNDTEESMVLEYNEHELVEEMITRFQKRLELIDKRQESYDNEKKLAENDEAFVKDLIESAEKKSKELDKFEEELEAKARELDMKEKELKTKINNVLPFANAVLENDRES